MWQPEEVVRRRMEAGELMDLAVLVAETERMAWEVVRRTWVLFVLLEGEAL